MSTPSNPLVLLANQLKACPDQDSRFSDKQLFEAWERFKHTGWERGKYPNAAVMAGLILHDEHVAELLNPTERAQFYCLSTAALERYQEKANPPNQVGKTIAATLKELT